MYAYSDTQCRTPACTLAARSGQVNTARSLQEGEQPNGERDFNFNFVTANREAQ